MTPTPGQPLSEADVSLLKKGDLLLCSIWGVVRFDRFDDSQRRAFVLDLKNDQVRLMVPAKMTFLGRPDQDGWIAWEGGENPVPGVKIDWRNEVGTRGTWLSDEVAGFGRPLNFNHRITHWRPHAPVSRPGDGVEWPAVTNVWAETYCELTGKNPDGQQVTFVDGATVTTFRDMAKREIEAMLCAAPKAAVRAIAALTPPAEPVSRPAGEGEGEREAVDWKDKAEGLEADLRSAVLVAWRRGAENWCRWNYPQWVEWLERCRPAAPDAGGGWMPIETAPKNGTWLIVSDGSSVEPAVWSDEEDDNGRSGWCAAGHSYGGVLYDLHYVLDFQPTHWMPLPAPPALQPGGER